MSPPPLALILADGEPPPEPLLRDWAARADGYFVTDGALEVALQLGCPPHVVLGDFDTLRARVPLGIEVVELDEQETTDLEKALYTVLGQGYRHAVILGAGGRRWDHFHHNLGLFARYSEQLVIEAGDAHGWLRLYRPGRHRLTATPGAPLSLLPLPVAEKVTTRGVQWPLTDADLRVAGRSGMCNRAEADVVSLEFRAGVLAVYWPSED